MKILYITNLSGWMASGVNVAVLQLINSICNYSDTYWLNLNKNSFEVNNKINKIKDLNAIKDNLPDIAVFEDPFNSIKFITISKKLREYKIPYIIVPHGCFNKKAIKRKKIKKMLVINTVLKPFLQGAYGVQYLTNDELNNSLQYKKLFVIPNGIKQSDFLNNSESIKDIVYIGRKDIHHKGLDLLIEACSLIRKDLEEKKCHVYIYGPSIKNDDNKINLLIDKFNISNIVINKGSLFGKEKEEVLKKADLFIQTSRYEGFPMSILEALSYGVPVLVTEGTNVSGLIAENEAGWVCKTDVNDISLTLKEAISNNKLRRFSENAKQLSTNYSWDCISKKTLEIYTKIIKDYREK